MRASRIVLLTAALALPLGAAVATWALPGEPPPSAPTQVRLRDNTGLLPSPSAAPPESAAPGTGQSTAPPTPPPDSPVVIPPPPPVPPDDDDDDADDLDD